MFLGNLRCMRETIQLMTSTSHSLGVRLEDSPNCGFMVHHNYEASLVVEVKSKQHLDKLLMELKESVLRKINEVIPLGWMVF